MSLRERGIALFTRLTEWSELEPSFRRRLGAIVTALTLMMVMSCLVLGILAASIIAPPLFSKSAFSADNLVNGARSNPTYPIEPEKPVVAPTEAAQHIAVVQVSPTVTALPTGVTTTTTTPLPTATTLPPTCPPTGNAAPTLAGNSVRLGTAPAPMLAACPTVLYISAPNQLNVPISITLFFGKTYQAECTIATTAARTDARGAAAIPFVVPPTTCFRGSILTTGTIIVGTDASADATLPANG